MHEWKFTLQNTFGCQFLMMLTKYFRLTNYTWMFCEGYYLHRLLANTFEEERSLAFILSIGWGTLHCLVFRIKNFCSLFSIFTGVPLIPCLLYGALRMMYDNKMCWALPASDAYVEWIYMAPGLACILANFVFFVNIFRILVTKLHAPHANDPAHFRWVIDNFFSITKASDIFTIGKPSKPQSFCFHYLASTGFSHCTDPKQDIASGYHSTNTWTYH